MENFVKDEFFKIWPFVINISGGTLSKNGTIIDLKPKNKITEEERIEIIETVNSPEHTDLAPSQIVRKLADEGKYIASESAIYRILEEKNECSPQ